MFNLYIKDLPKVTKYSKPYQYADDSVLLKSIFSEKDFTDFQSDLNALENWCSEKNLKINPNKSVNLRFSFKNTDHLPKYT